MKFLSTRLFSALALPLALAVAAPPAADTVILDETGAKNLRIATVIAEPRDFEETIFALGRIDVYPGNRAVISSRIAGRALEVFVRHDHPISAGETAFVIESRQPGNPPPVIKLTAPITGLISTVHVVTGEPVNPDKPLAEIIDLRKVYAIARVPEHLASRLRPGQSARLQVPAAGERVFTATLEHLGALADAATGTVEAAFHLDNADLVLRPGMRAEFSIVTARRPDVTAVPRAALQGDATNRFVYVKDFSLPHAFIKTPVVTGQMNDQHVEIISGLFPADEVVTQGAYSLAFAGAGSLSLKEALDAAHGHAHNPDGSEMSDPGKNSAASTGNAADHGHDHAHADEHDHAHADPFWKIVSGGLFLALLVVSFFKRAARPTGEATPPARPQA